MRNGFQFAADLSIEPGARIAVIGPSGSGKSTLLSVIGGFLAPDAGSVAWQGADLSAVSPGQRPVSFLFQDQNLFPHLTIGQNIGLGLRPDLRLNRRQREDVEHVIAQVGLQGMSTRRPAELSGGQQSRVALARVLLRARPILLLDEPFAALGPALKAEMLKLLGDIATRTDATVLMVTHDPADARSFADRTILVDDGKVHPPAPTNELLESPPPGLRAYLGQ
ncbi:ATP-binding cassette domain-containing protein [Paracoccus sp. Z330]|uniref:ATP-binding cassette domain-containing protein n=2 Tax=Paracoccus onchidii TaxID=3017813 RepID=A0ABT4ZCJ9_9RHOB|nr:ATP-binding cassette domain-containing protein [Paracoccus onchidii]MDB6177081.1 ATP-binding cassette domain-containing protein [Paracoccus onchidii]